MDYFQNMSISIYIIPTLVLRTFIYRIVQLTVFAAFDRSKDTYLKEKLNHIFDLVENTDRSEVYEY